jgi:hypothetical protein
MRRRWGAEGLSVATNPSEEATAARVRDRSAIYPSSRTHRIQFIGPVGQCPTIQIYTTDGAVTRHAALYIGNLLATTLKLFRQWKIIGSMVSNGSGNESPPSFERKFPDTPVLTSINEPALERSRFVPVPEFRVFSKAGECFRERF